MSSEKQINYINNLQNRTQNLYYIDDASELNNINLKENDKVYAINDNKLFQMEINDQEQELNGENINFKGRNNTKIAMLTANIEPVQDFHGYDSQWPPGGGKNKFNPDEAQNNKWINTTSGAIESAKGFWITGFIPVKSGDVIRCPLKGSSINAWYNTDKSQATFFDYLGTSDTSSGSGVTAPKDGYVVITILNSTIAFNSDFIVTINNNDITFQPYSNICPISGWTGMRVQRTGSNLLDFSKASAYHASISGVGGNFIATATGNIYPHAILNVDELAGKGQFYISANVVRSGAGFIDSTCLIGQYTLNGKIYYTAIRGSSPFVDNVSDTIDAIVKFPAGSTNCIISIYISNTTSTLTNASVRVTNMRICSQPGQAYEPYQGDIYNINFPNEIGTVYGGTLDVTSGMLMVDRVMVDMGTLPWGFESSTAHFYSNGIVATSINWPNWDETPPLLCSRYKPIANSQLASEDFCISYTYNNAYDSKQLRVKDSDYTDATSFKTAMAGIQLVYNLATTITYQLTPIEIKTLLGVNNIWADTGAVNIKIIEKGITAFELMPYI